MFEGKTLFNYYLLVRLLQQKQVILFSPDGEEVFLFYHNEVYTLRMEALSAYMLPQPIFSDVFIWSLFDIREAREPKKFLVNYPCFPVQVTSPNPIRYKVWDKERMPLRTGLPLWTRDELAQGCVVPITFLSTSEHTLPRLQYQDRYWPLLDALRKAYSLVEAPLQNSNMSDPLGDYTGARALLDKHYGCGDTEPSPEDALDYLLDAAIDRFGYSARDVFGGVFQYLEMSKRYEAAFNTTYDKLRDAISALSGNQTADDSVSHRILAVHPVDQGFLMSVRWDVDFKSDWVARSVLPRLQEAEENKICEQIRLFRNIPEGGSVAGRLLEPLAHRYITDSTSGIWPLIRMNSNLADPPQFTLVRDTPVPGNVCFMKVKRKIVRLSSISVLSTSVQDDSYYIPTDPNFPLFDAFTVQLDRTNRTAILWILQMTTSRRHGGSADGYEKIREIITILKSQLQERPPLKKSKTEATPKPDIKVRYLLVVPKPEDESQCRDLPHWKFPKGWSERCTRNDHRGDVYCLEVPLSPRELIQG